MLLKCDKKRLPAIGCLCSAQLNTLRGHYHLRHGPLLGLISLARRAEEERVFRAAAYLYDPEHNPAILAKYAASTGADAGAMESGWSASVTLRGLAPLPPLSLERL